MASFFMHGVEQAALPTVMVALGVDVQEGEYLVRRVVGADGEAWTSGVWRIWRWRGSCEWFWKS